ncbi:MAG: C45 family autoproteolytic acyltransferase/hydrolase [Candidatus Aminicenantia bacterium]
MSKKKFRILTTIFLVSIFFFSTGIAQTLSKQEKGWLAKAHRYDKNGWIFLYTEGKPFEIGFQRGYLTAEEIDDFLKTLAYTQKFKTGKDLGFFVKAANELFKDKVDEEYVQEMKGMVAGMKKAGKKITYEEMLFSNAFIDVVWYWWSQEKKMMELHRPGCSAFIATGEATADGKIVMAHNSWSDYTTLRFCNIIISIIPEKGYPIFMQTWGPCLYSATDFFITGAGLIGTETTIGGFSGFNPEGTPVFQRARKAMQYARTIDEWANIMIENNNGAYANSWLLGDIKTNEIACLELGLKHHSLQKKKSGYFTGSNVTDNIEILREETDSSYVDIRDFCVSRRVRWKQLMKKYYGKIDVEITKQMLADHYDVYLEKEKPTSRTICGHWELDDGNVPGSRSPYYPGGAIDGKVVNSEMAKNWQFWAIWGSSCDIGFDADKFLEKHIQYEWLRGYLKDLPVQSWTLFSVRKTEQKR